VAGAADPARLRHCLAVCRPTPSHLGGHRRRVPPGLQRAGIRLGTEFLPKLEEGNMWIRALLPPTITLEAGMDSVARMRNIVRSYAPVRTVVSEQGRGEDATDPDGSFVAEFFVPLKPQEEWPRD